MPAQATFGANVAALLTGVSALNAIQGAVNYTPNLTLVDGTGAGQIDSIWAARRTLAASANEDLDLNGTALKDALGNNLALVRVKGILIASASANANNIIVGNAASNGWITWNGGAAHTVTVRPGGFFMLGAPDATAYAVTATSGDLLRIANAAGGTSVTYDIVILGASA